MIGEEDPPSTTILRLPFARVQLPLSITSKMSLRYFASPHSPIETSCDGPRRALGMTATLKQPSSELSQTLWSCGLTSDG